MHNDKVTIRKLEVINPVTYYNIPMYFCQKKIMDALYVNEITRTEWIEVIDGYWGKKYTLFELILFITTVVLYVGSNIHWFKPRPSVDGTASEMSPVYWITSKYT